jgi:hypothetical protein
VAKNPTAVAKGRIGGRKGGVARAKSSVHMYHSELPGISGEQICCASAVTLGCPRFRVIWRHAGFATERSEQKAVKTSG